MGNKNTVPTRTDREFYNLIKEIQADKMKRFGKFMPTSKITKGIVKWKGIINLKKALVEEWE